MPRRRGSEHERPPLLRRLRTSPPLAIALAVLVLGALALVWFRYDIVRFFDTSRDYQVTNLHSDAYLTETGQGASVAYIVEQYRVSFRDDGSQTGMSRELPRSLHGVAMNPSVISVTDGEGRAVPYTTFRNDDWTTETIRTGETGVPVTGEHVYRITYSVSKPLRRFASTSADEFNWPVTPPLDRRIGDVVATVHVPLSLTPRLQGAGTCWIAGPLQDDRTCQTTRVRDTYDRTLELSDPSTTPQTMRAALADLASAGEVAFVSYAPEVRPGDELHVAVGFAEGSFDAPAAEGPVVVPMWALVLLTSIAGLPLAAALVARFARPWRERDRERGGWLSRRLERGRRSAGGTEDAQADPAPHSAAPPSPTTARAETDAALAALLADSDLPPLRAALTLESRLARPLAAELTLLATQRSLLFTRRDPDAVAAWLRRDRVTGGSTAVDDEPRRGDLSIILRRPWALDFGLERASARLLFRRMREGSVRTALRSYIAPVGLARGVRAALHYREEQDRLRDERGSRPRSIALLLAVVFGLAYALVLPIVFQASNTLGGRTMLALGVSLALIAASIAAAPSVGPLTPRGLEVKRGLMRLKRAMQAEVRAGRDDSSADDAVPGNRAHSSAIRAERLLPWAVVVSLEYSWSRYTDSLLARAGIASGVTAGDLLADIEFERLPRLLKGAASSSQSFFGESARPPSEAGSPATADVMDAAWEIDARSLPRTEASSTALVSAREPELTVIDRDESTTMLRSVNRLPMVRAVRRVGGTIGGRGFGPRRRRAADGETAGAEEVREAAPEAASAGEKASDSATAGGETPDTARARGLRRLLGRLRRH